MLAASVTGIVLEISVKPRQPFLRGGAEVAHAHVPGRTHGEIRLMSGGLQELIIFQLVAREEIVPTGDQVYGQY